MEATRGQLSGALRWVLLGSLFATLERRISVVSGDGDGPSALRTALAGARRALAERVMMDGFDRGTTNAWSTVEQ